MIFYDAHCDNCGKDFEEATRTPTKIASECPFCASAFTRRIWKTVPILDKAKDPYDNIGKIANIEKPIKSFANDKRNKPGKRT